MKRRRQVAIVGIAVVAGVAAIVLGVALALGDEPRTWPPEWYVDPAANRDLSRG
jgi:hypothetical protein